MSCASGCKQEKIFDNSAFGYWLLAFGQKEQQPQLTFILRPSADWDSAHSRAKAAREWGPLGLGLGLGLGGAWVALGPPKRHPRATQGPSKRRMTEVFCLQRELKNGGGGSAGSLSTQRLLWIILLILRFLGDCRVPSPFRFGKPQRQSRDSEKRLYFLPALF